jgi:hypothetical protein
MLDNIVPDSTQHPSVASLQEKDVVFRDTTFMILNKFEKNWMASLVI